MQLYTVKDRSVPVCHKDKTVAVKRTEIVSLLAPAKSSLVDVRR